MTASKKHGRMALLAWLLLGFTACAAEPETNDATSERLLHGSVLVEVGHATPPVGVLRVHADHPAVVQFTLEGGVAEFDGGGRSRDVIASSRAAVTLPSIRAGVELDESVLVVELEGEELFRLRVASLPPGGVALLSESLSAIDGAILHAEEHAAIVDEDLVAAHAHMSGAPETMMSTDETDVDTNIDTDIGPYGLCVRTPFGPGRVEWAFGNPAASGYSVKPESVWNLIWAAAPGQDIDGIYRRVWGCGTALKVPDSCTATVDAGGNISCCCNATMAALGHVCQWVNPGGIGWPNCPL